MKNEMKAMIVFGTLIVLVSSLIEGCGKSKGEKNDTENSRRENKPPPATKNDLGEKNQKASIDFFEEKEVLEPEKVVPELSPGEIVKKFYATVSKGNYSEAQNCLSSRLLALLESHPVSRSKGIESALDVVAASDVLEKITVIKEGELSIDVSDAKVLGIRELQSEGGKLGHVDYKLTLKATLRKLVPVTKRTDYLIEENGTYKITKISGELTPSFKDGIAKFIAENLVARLCDYKVVDFSHFPSESEGWTDYVAHIVVNNLSTGLAGRALIVPDICALSDGHEFRTVIGHPRKYLGDHRDSGYFLPPGCFAHYKAALSVPSRVSRADFYMVTPDLRRFNISTQGPFSSVPEFSPRNENELSLGKPFVLKQYWEISPIGLTLTQNPDQLRLWVKMKNMTLEDRHADSSFYFQLLNEEGSSEEMEIVGTIIPPLFERTRCFERKIKKRVNYALLVGILDPNSIRENPKELLAYKVYRFDAQPTPALNAPKIRIDEVQVSDRIVFKIRNVGDLPAAIGAARIKVPKGFRDVDVVVDQWIEPNTEIVVRSKRSGGFSLPIMPLWHAQKSITIEILTFGDEIIASYSGKIDMDPEGKIKLVSKKQTVSKHAEESPTYSPEHSGKQELVDALEELRRAMMKKIQMETDITAQSFTSVKEYRRAKLLADVLRPVLRVLQGTLSVLSKIGDTTTLSGQVKTSLDNAQYVSEAASLFFMVNGLRESGKKLYYAIDDTAGYVRTVKDMLQAADQTTVIRMDPRAYKQVIKQYLDSEQGTPLVIARTSELAPDKKPARGALVLYKTIREEFRTLIEQIQRSELPQDFPLQDAVAEIEQLKHQIVEAGVHNINVHYSIYHQGRKVHQSRKLGAVAEHNKAFAQVAGALAKSLDIEIYAECAQLAATGADAAYIVTYKIPGAGEAVKMTQQVSLLPQIVIEGKKMFTVDPEEQFYQMPQEMLFSLAIEFSSLLRIADDTVLSLTELLKETRSQVPPVEVRPAPTSTKRKEPAKKIEKQTASVFFSSL